QTSDYYDSEMRKAPLGGGGSSVIAPCHLGKGDPTFPAPTFLVPDGPVLYLACELNSLGSYPQMVFKRIDPARSDAMQTVPGPKLWRWPGFTVNDKLFFAVAGGTSGPSLVWGDKNGTSGSEPLNFPAYRLMSNE